MGSETFAVTQINAAVILLKKKLHYRYHHCNIFIASRRIGDNIANTSFKTTMVFQLGLIRIKSDKTVFTLHTIVLYLCLFLYLLTLKYLGATNLILNQDLLIEVNKLGLIT